MSKEYSRCGQFGVNKKLRKNCIANAEEQLSDVKELRCLSSITDVKSLDRIKTILKNLRAGA